MANAVSHVAVTTPTVGMPALLPVMVNNHARSAMRGATSSAATRDVQKSAANHAHHVLKKNVLPTLPVQHAVCCTVRLGAMFRAMQKIFAMRSSMPIYLWRRLPERDVLPDLRTGRDQSPPS